MPSMIEVPAPGPGQVLMIISDGVRWKGQLIDMLLLDDGVSRLVVQELIAMVDQEVP